MQDAQTIILDIFARARREKVRGRWHDLLGHVLRDGGTVALLLLFALLPLALRLFLLLR